MNVRWNGQVSLFLKERNSVFIGTWMFSQILIQKYTRIKHSTMFLLSFVEKRFQSTFIWQCGCVKYGTLHTMNVYLSQLFKTIVVFFKIVLRNTLKTKFTQMFMKTMMFFLQNPCFEKTVFKRKAFKYFHHLLFWSLLSNSSWCSITNQSFHVYWKFQRSWGSQYLQWF